MGGGNELAWVHIGHLQGSLEDFLYCCPAVMHIAQADALVQPRVCIAESLLPECAQALIMGADRSVFTSHLYNDRLQVEQTALGKVISDGS